MRHSSRAWVRADMFKTTPGEAHRGSLPEKAPFLFNFHHVCSEPVLAIDRIFIRNSHKPGACIPHICRLIIDPAAAPSVSDRRVTHVDRAANARPDT